MKEFEEGSGMRDLAASVKQSIEKTSNTKDVGDVVDMLMSTCRTPAVRTWGQAVETVKAKTKQEVEALAYKERAQSASPTQQCIVSLLNPNITSPLQPSSRSHSPEHKSTSPLPETSLAPVQEDSDLPAAANSVCIPRVRRQSIDECATQVKRISRVTEIFNEGDKPMNVSNVLRVLEKLELFSPALNYQIARKVNTVSVLIKADQHNSLHCISHYKVNISLHFI